MHPNCDRCGCPIASIGLCERCEVEAEHAATVKRLGDDLVAAKKKIGSQLMHIAAAMSISDDAVMYSDSDSYPTKEWRNRAAKWLKNA